MIVNCTGLFALEAVWSRFDFSLYVISWASQVALVAKNLPANAEGVRVPGSTPGLRRSPGEGHGSPLQCSCLKNPMDRGAW